MILSTIFLQTSNASSDSKWAIVAAIAAVLSAIFALYSNRIANKALKLAKQEYRDKQTNFSVYIIDGFRWAETNENRKFLLFNVSIRNKSNSKDSFKARLEIKYVKTDHSIEKIIIDHNPELLNIVPQKNLSVFPSDIRLEEKGIESKWLIFEQPINVFTDYRIEEYSILIQNIHDNVEREKLVILKEIINEI